MGGWAETVEIWEVRRINVELGRVIDWVGGQLQWSLFLESWWVGGWVSGHMGH